MEKLDNMGLFSYVFQENKLYQMKNFHCLVHLIKTLYKHFCDISLIKSARMLDNFFKDSSASYFDFSVMFIFFRKLANDNHNCS